jgi:polyphosphate kinase 2 (PPK2 family)
METFEIRKQLSITDIRRATRGMNAAARKLETKIKAVAKRQAALSRLLDAEEAAAKAGVIYTVTESR